MKILRSSVAITVAVFTMGPNYGALAQETNVSPFSITLAPLQYVHVKGNVDKFRALNWTKAGYEGGISDAVFIKQINKDVSLDVEGSMFPKTNNYDDELILKDGDLAFLKINYKSFRKYFDKTGGVYKDGGFPASLSGVKAKSPDLKLDISYLKLEAGLGQITDPFLDVAYEHNLKDGHKSLLMWTDATPLGVAAGNGKKLGPSWQDIYDTVDRVTLKEKKKVAGITIKGQQQVEIDYNHHLKNARFLTNDPSASLGQTLIQEAFPDAKIFSSGISGEKWMFNDKTFASLGYHYSHIHATELLRNQELSPSGVVTNYVYPATNGPNTFQEPLQSLWSYAKSLQDQHVCYSNFNSNLTPNLEFITDLRYERVGTRGFSTYLENGSFPIVDGTVAGGTATSTDTSSMKNLENREGEHLELRYYGVDRTTLYAQVNMQQDRFWFWQSRVYNPDPNSFTYFQERMDRSQKVSWALGGRTVLNKFLTFSAQAGQRFEDHVFDNISGRSPDSFLDRLKINAQDASGTLTWKPYRWATNSFRYQFSNTQYLPRDEAGSNPPPTGGRWAYALNHMLSSAFTYDITLQPVDPLLLLLSYSHVESYVRTVAASQRGVSISGNNYIPTFNSGNNSWLFSASYTPLENVTLTNSVMYTISNNYVDFTDGLPLGSSFRELTFTTGFDWTYHKWLKLGPKYGYASYRDNSLVGAGNYSANMFILDVNFRW